MSIQPYLGVNVNAASVEELRYRGLLEEGEVLLALFDGILLDENRRRVGGLALTDFLALTDRRLITWARGFFNDAVDGFVWTDVDVVDAETWDPWHGRVRLAFRLPAVAPRTRRIAVRGSTEAPGQEERVLLNTLDYVPVEDVTVLANMVAWIGDQIVQGVSGEQLVEAFVGEYPAVERQPPAPFFQMQPEPPPPAPVEQPLAEQPKRRWWQWGKAEEPTPTLEPPTTPGNLIAAYESRRQGAPLGSGPQAGPLPQSPLGPIPTLPEQPNMYEVSRSLRLVLEVPRRLARGVRRAGEMMGGANELISGMQDPQVRRNAMRGIYRAAAQQEAENGPLAPVGPVVRAAVRFSEPLEQEQAEPASRRIQVRSAVRRSSPEAPPAEPPAVRPISLASRATPAAEPPAAEPAGPVRRSISVRRVEPPQPAPEPVASEPESAEPPRVPVRRIAINRSESVQPVTYTNGNGRHEDEV